jgi:hypothetical protein
MLSPRLKVGPLAPPEPPDPSNTNSACTDPISGSAVMITEFAVRSIGSFIQKLTLSPLPYLLTLLLLNVYCVATVAPPKN